MNLTIHRGTKEIGGSCVEIATATTRILVDFGMPLVDAKHEPFDSKSLAGKSIVELKEQKILPDIKGLYAGEASGFDAILISHSHFDHYGFLQYVHPDIPIYMSRGAAELIEVSSLFTPNKISGLNTRLIKGRGTFKINDLSITPFVVDHSAFDALAFLIEAEGKRIFYSGDFRAHGRKSALFERIVQYPPENIDCLLIPFVRMPRATPVDGKWSGTSPHGGSREGSMLGWTNEKYPNEESIQTRIEVILKSAQTITFLFASSQNIDRIVSAYKACLKTNTLFVIDIYTAYILDRLRTVSKNIPQFNWKNMRIKFYKNQADTLAEKVSQKLLYFYNTRKIDRFELERRKNKILMLARDNSIFPEILRSLGDVNGARIIYSMWDGYLTDQFKEYCEKHGLTIEQVHTSGHATVDDLKAFASALKPKVLIPIHTFDAQKYPSLFENVKILNDGELHIL